MIEPISTTEDVKLLKPAEPTEKPAEIPVPPQGSVAPCIVRTKDDAAKVPDKMKPMLLDKDGNPLPQWVQVARMFHKPYKKVAIVGFADTKSEAPYPDPTWEIWGLNDLHGTIPRYDRWFDIHPRSNIEQDCNLMRNKGVTPPENIGLNGLKKLNVPIYMHDHFDDIPNSIKFPLDEVVKSFQFGEYMTNSVSYMIALAILEGYQEISVYGVDMAVGGEYVEQRPSCEYWLGIAAGRGIKLYIPPASDLCHTRFMYGFQEAKQSAWEEKMDSMLKNMMQRQQGIQNQEQQARDARMQYEGAIGFCRESKKVWANLHTKL